MASYKTTGLVLRRFNLGEADRIITFFTPDRGKIRVVARGVRKSKSRMAGHLELFSQTDLMLAEGRNLDIITSAKLVRYRHKLVENYKSLAYAYLLAEMIDKLTEDGEPHYDIYQIAEECLGEIDSSGGGALVELYFKLKLLSGLGYHPNLKKCTACNNKLSEEDHWFSPELGGVVDRLCYRADYPPINSREIKLWRLVLSEPLDRLGRVGGVEMVAKGSLDVCELFYDFVFGRRFKSSELLRL